MPRVICWNCFRIFAVTKSKIPNVHEFPDRVNAVRGGTPEWNECPRCRSVVNVEAGIRRLRGEE